MPALLLGSRARSHPRFLFVTRHKTATVFGRGHRSRTLLNLLEINFLSFAHFLKTFLQYSVFFFLFSFSLLSFNYSIYSSSTISKRDVIVTENFFSNNFSRQPEDQSRVSNFALFTSKIKKKIPSSLTNQHSVILPSRLLAMVTVRPIDLISRVYRTHHLVYRCAKKRNNKVKMYVQLGIKIKLDYLAIIKISKKM